MAEKRAHCITLGDLLRLWHETHQKWRKMYYIAEVGMTGDIRDLIQDYGYDIEYGAFYYGFPTKEKELVGILLNKHDSELVIACSEDF